MKKSVKKAEFHVAEVITLIIITCIISILMGFLLGNRVIKENGFNEIQDQNVSEFLKNYEYILEKYYGEVDSKKLMEGALNGMLSSLGDDYSMIIDSDSFDAQLEGNYQGIGIEIYRQEDKIIILNVFDGSPAEKAGLQTGDIINKIDGVDYNNKETAEITNYIKNSKTGIFKFEVLRGSEILNLTIERTNVTIPSISKKIFERNNKKIGYIYIDIFATATISQFENALKELEKEKIDSLVIDVRGNSGGHLTTVVDILSNLLDSKHVIYQTQTKTNTKRFYSEGSKTKTYPIAILQNKSSASASELLSVALKEEYGAVVIGENSYGKGTVQEVVTSGNTEYKFTTKKWLSPKGNWINGTGVTPDIVVSLESAYYENPCDETDNQLQTALNELSK